MSDPGVVYVVGSGAVGMALVVCLVNAGRRAVAVRTTTRDAGEREVEVRLQNGADRIDARVETVGLSRLRRPDGTIAIAAKSYANKAIAAELAGKAAGCPLVILENGVGVEAPFLEIPLSEVYRCVLYVTSEVVSDGDIRFRAIKPSLIGVVRGAQAGRDRAVQALSTPRFPFAALENIQREVWKKAVINAVFNSICPLLEVDNGVFARDPAVLGIAGEVVAECIGLTDRLGLGLSRDEVMEQVLQISRSSDGQLISTLQDIRKGQETEIDFLNMEIARTAAAQRPAVSVPMTEVLGRLTLARAAHAAAERRGKAGGGRR